MGFVANCCFAVWVVWLMHVASGCCGEQVANVIVTTQWPKSERYHAFLETAEFLWRINEIDSQGEEEGNGKKHGGREEFWKYVDTIASGSNYSFGSEELRKLNAEAINNGIYASSLESERVIVERMKKAFAIECNEPFAVVVEKNLAPSLLCASWCLDDSKENRINNECFERKKKTLSSSVQLDFFPAYEKQSNKKKNEFPTLLVIGELGEANFNSIYLFLKDKQEKEGGTLVIRFYSFSTPSSFYQIGGFGVHLDVKNTEYITLDKNAEASKKEAKDNEISGVDLVKFEQFGRNKELIELLKKGLKKERDKLKWWELKDLAMQAASFILGRKKERKNDLEPFERLKSITLSFPKYVKQLLSIPVDEAKRERRRKMIGVTGLFLNGAQLDTTKDLLHVFNQVKAFVRFGALFDELKLKFDLDGENFLSFSKKVGKIFDPIEERVDIRKGAKGAVVFFNNVEKDEMYSRWPRDKSSLLAYSKEFKFPVSFSSVLPIRKNLFTVLYTFKKSPNAGSVIRAMGYLLRMGVNIRFGLVFGYEEEGKNQCGERCLLHLYYITKKKYGLEVANEMLIEILSSNLDDKEAIHALYLDSMVRLTQSWDSGKFKKMLNDGEKESFELMDRMIKYANNINLCGNCLYLNGIELRPNANGEIDLEGEFLPLLIKEQEMIIREIEKLSFDDGDITANILKHTNAKNYISQLTNPTVLDASSFFVLKEEKNVEAIKVMVVFEFRCGELVDGKFFEEAKKILDREEMDVAPYFRVLQEIDNDDEGKQIELSSLSIPFTFEAVVGVMEKKCSNVCLRDQCEVRKQHAAIVNGRRIEFSSMLDLNAVVNEERQRMDRVLSLFSKVEKNKFLFYSSLSKQVSFRSFLRKSEKEPARSEGELEYSFQVPGNENFLLTLLVNPLSLDAQNLIAYTSFLLRVLNPTLSVTLEIQHVSHISQVLGGGFNYFASTLLRDDAVATFASIPPSQILTMKILTPDSWIAYPEAFSQKDPDNLIFKDNETLSCSYKLAHLVVEGHAILPNGQPAEGMLLELKRDEKKMDSIVMNNLGYWQFKASPGVYTLSSSIDSKAFELQSNHSIVLRSHFTQALTTYAKRAVEKRERRTETNSEVMHVFSLASGALYERFLRIMMLSVRKRSSGKIKFWLLENYMSKEMKEYLPRFAEKYGVEYTLVTYKWPHWLRAQTERQRQIWGMKILFLDVLFPLEVERIIYVDSDQVLRSDLRELWDLDLHGAPYGFTPFCDSRKETLGFQFWRSGYWFNHLQGKPYHISALFVVDLKVFRENAVGDRLRATYHALSAEPGSLSNLDQDLPNYMQSQGIEIYSLPQDWLWCESWCSDESKKTSKTIDLCNNPLFKEPKLEMAKRVIKGELFQESWDDLDDEVNALYNQR